MLNDTVRTAVRNLIALRLAQLGTPEVALTDDTDLIGSGLLDSLEVVTLIEEVEAKTGYRFVEWRFSAEDGLTLGSFAASFAAR